MTRQTWAPCSVPGCPELSLETRCVDHMEREVSRRSGPGSRRYMHIYQHPTWRGLRARVRAEQPFCRCGCNQPWTDLDHIIPLAEGGAPFDRANLEGRCKESHSRKTAGEVARQRAADQEATG